MIYSLDEYRQKRIRAQKFEARELVLEYYKVYKKLPDESILAEFFWLFSSRESIHNPAFIQKMNCVRNYDYSINVFMKTESEFKTYNDFLKYCFDGNLPK